jgi:hypothetical protein
MAYIYINEYNATGAIGTLPITAPPGRALARQQVAISGTSTPSAAFNAFTNMIMVSTDSICSITIGPPTPVAVMTYERMAANETRFYVVVPGDELAVISNT